MSSPSNYLVHTLLRARDWQHRPEFDQVCAWWRGGGLGVCALVGIGGAGKTAIAERFLNEIPNVMPVPISDSVATRIDLPLREPRSVFVYSFYDDDKPENFFRHLQIWLEGSPRLEKELSPSQIMFLVQQCQGLMILDGLEKVQDNRARGGFGKLTSPTLRDLLNHIACGSARELSVLVTSRFLLADLRDSQPRFFQTIAVEEIGVAVGIQLLRARGVRGTDVQLTSIVEHCGRHALTIDLAGGYIKEYGGGDPATPLYLGTAEELQAKAEQEPDDDKRAVLKQGIRFHRIAERYREAMLSSDEAALALLERICLFRLGVDCKTLAAIFTGSAAEKASGEALASLNATELQKKLDCLVGMRIVERTTSPSPNAEDRTPRVLYNVHPAVRDSFVANLSAGSTRDNGDLIRRHLEDSLPDPWKSSKAILPTLNIDDAIASNFNIALEAVTPGHSLSARPGAPFPSNHSTLDLLEEIVYHTIVAGELSAAWDMYIFRLGAYTNLGRALAAYERGERICRMFNPIGPTPRTELGSDLAKRVHAYLLYEFSLYLKNLGDLEESVNCCNKYRAIATEAGDSLGQSLADRILCDAFLLSGHLRAAISSGDESMRTCQTAPAEFLANNHAFRGSAQTYAGKIALALRDFDEALQHQVKQEGAIDVPYLFAQRAVRFINLLIRLGRLQRAHQLATDNIRIVNEYFGSGNQWTPTFRLFLCDLRCVAGKAENEKSEMDAISLEIRQKNIPLWNCQLAVVMGRFELSMVREARLDPKEKMFHLERAKGALEEGLRIARGCGYGLYHIDLLLEWARLHLLCGDPGRALEEIELALNTGVPANDESGQPELLAANDEECGYAWAIPTGLQLRAEALLLKVAQLLGRDSFVVAKRHEQPANVQALIQQAENYVNRSLELWQTLRDPEPDNANFVHPETGAEYNYRASETYRVLMALAGGVLTQYLVYPWTAPPKHSLIAIAEANATMSFHVFLSYNSKDKPIVRQIGTELKHRGLNVWLDEWELRPGMIWQHALEDIIQTCCSAAVCVADNGTGPWEDPEMMALIRRFVNEKKTGNVLPVIPVLLPGAPANVKLPPFLEAFTWVDLRSGMTSEGIDRLIWGITGKKPGP